MLADDRIEPRLQPHLDRRLRDLSATVGMPRIWRTPDFFGIGTAFTGAGKSLPECIRFQSLYRLSPSFFSNRSIVSASMPAAHWLAFTCNHAYHLKILGMS
jgi:hypothetical protein